MCPKMRLREKRPWEKNKQTLITLLLYSVNLKRKKTGKRIKSLQFHTLEFFCEK